MNDAGFWTGLIIFQLAMFFIQYMLGSIQGEILNGIIFLATVILAVTDK